MSNGPDEHPILLSALPPSCAEIRLAFFASLAMAGGLLVTLAFADVRLPEANVFIPIVATIVCVNDLITGVLLFAQFSFVRTHALLVLACGYLINSLLIIPYILTQPGAFSPSGLLGAGLQTTSWLFVFWNVIPSAALITYVALKDARSWKAENITSLRSDIIKSVVAVIAIVCGLTWLVTAHENLLPAMLEQDGMRVTAVTRQIITPFIAVLDAVLVGLLWRRWRSLLDLWLLVVAWSWLLRAIMQIFVDARFSLSWYSVRFFWALSSIFLLLVLMTEGTVLYVRLALSVAAHQRERAGRLMTMDAVVGSIAHEIRQPLSAIVANASAGLNWLKRAQPDHLQDVNGALKDILEEALRMGDVISSIRGLFGKDRRERSLLDLNDVIRETLSLVRRELEIQSVSLHLELAETLPPAMADRMQLQQVLLNILINAVEAMDSMDRPRSLSVKSKRCDEQSILISVADSGTGIDPTHADRIFDPFFTTKARGTGIGLCLCRSVIESHGGRLWASPCEPHGTIFYVQLPGAAQSQREDKKSPAD